MDLDYAYTVVIESEDQILTVHIDQVCGLAHARDVLRKKYPFNQWRIVNIAAVHEPSRLPYP